MAIETPCSKCNKSQAPYMNPKTEEVFCSICDSKLNANHFLKIQLKTLKQYREVKKVPFAVKCKKCNTEDTPKLLNGEIVCSKCNSKLDHLTETFKNMLKQNLGKVGEDI